jgi:hypothetical protein
MQDLGTHSRSGSCTRNASLLFVWLACVPALAIAAPEKLPTIAEKTAGFEKRSGLLDFYVDRNTGTVWLELPPPGAAGEIGQYLYFEGLRTGLGSNPVGLDRSQLGDTRLVRLREVGGRVLLEQLNTRYRALSGDAAERQAAEQSFATSVLWAGKLAARGPGGRLLVDFTTFLVRDAHGIVRALETSEQGSYSLDADRSTVDLDACLAFPENVVFEALLTFKGSKPGSEVRATAPEPEAITLVLNHSLLKLPEPGYAPRDFDPRIGCYPLVFADYAAPLDEPIEKRWISRHRLEKVDPTAARSRVKKPIVFYVDRGVPEPVRSALIEGAGWWSAAFEAAGFIDAFRVELLPEGAHPLDARYSVINWVHRATRGWSYGWGVVDPRTGEFVKGHVLLGSLRVRQDRLLFEGLVGTANTGSGGPDDPIQLALARIRQLAAHEVGHALGVAHNFAASSYGRESVMDYPAPLVRITPQGDLDVSQAYDVGVGAWDIHTIRYAYTQFAPGTDEKAGLDAIVRDGIEHGLHFISDEDARPPGAAQPRGNLWDNSDTPEAELAHVLDVRRIALDRFGPNNLPAGSPLALLEEVLVPVYYMHRYALDACVKVVGGVEYAYAVRGDGQPGATPLAADRQRVALDALVECLQPAQLDLPENVVRTLLPRPFGYDRNREQFATATYPTFDALGVAQTAASMVVEGLLQRERCARLVDQHRRDPSLPGLETVLERLRDVVFEQDLPGTSRLDEIQRGAQRALVDALLDLAADVDATARVRGSVESTLRQLRHDLDRKSGDPAQRAHEALLVADLDRHFGRGLEAEATAGAEPLPPGSPIGGRPERASPDPPAGILSGCSWDTRLREAP